MDIFWGWYMVVIFQLKFFYWDGRPKKTIFGDQLSWPGSGLELYASLEEVGDPLPKLLPPLRPPVISATEEVMVLDKPSGLRTEDALRAMMAMMGWNGISKSWSAMKCPWFLRFGVREQTDIRIFRRMLGLWVDASRFFVFRGNFGVEASKSPSFLVSLWFCLKCWGFVQQKHPGAELVSRLDKEPADAYWSPWQRWARKSSHNNLRKTRWDTLRDGWRFPISLSIFYAKKMCKWCKFGGFMDCRRRPSINGCKCGILHC